MTIRHMKIFVRVCEEKSVTKAAEKLYIAQPSVSQAIIDIETELGLPLFDRISRRLYITDAGKQLYEYMVHILSLYAEMEDHMKNWNRTGSIHIGSSITIGNQIIPRLVSTFRNTHPQVQIFVTIDNSDTIEQKVLSGELDFALIEGIVHSNQILSKKFMDDRLVLICSKNDPLSEQDTISVTQMKQYPFLSREKGSGTREIIDSSLLAHNIYLTPIWESISTQALISAVKNGIGISILPYRLAEPEIKSGDIVCVGIQEISFDRPFHMIHSCNKYLSPTVKDLMKAVNSLSNTDI